MSKGTWCQWWHFPEDDAVAEAAWQMVKNGEITGVSIHSSATGEEIE